MIHGWKHAVGSALDANGCISIILASFLSKKTHLVIRKTWFLDQEIPAGGFVRIQDSSQVW
jgi:hypothetical protein